MALIKIELDAQKAPEAKEKGVLERIRKGERGREREREKERERKETILRCDQMK